MQAVKLSKVTTSHATTQHYPNTCHVTTSPPPLSPPLSSSLSSSPLPPPMLPPLPLQIATTQGHQKRPQQGLKCFCLLSYDEQGARDVTCLKPQVCFFCFSFFSYITNFTYVFYFILDIYPNNEQSPPLHHTRRTNGQLEM